MINDNYNFLPQKQLSFAGKTAIYWLINQAVGFLAQETK
jgi:hypothetical protein